MANEFAPNDMRNVWQNQKAEGILMSVEEIRRKAVKFEREVFWENALYYFLGLLGAVFFSFRFVLHGPNVLFRLGVGMCVAVMLYLVWQIHRRTPFRQVPADIVTESCLEFHRKELERRRDYHRRFLKLCLLPTIPGWVVLMAAFVQVHPPHLGWRLAVANASAVLIFWIFWSESRWRVRKLQHQIDEIDVIPRER